MKSKKIANIVFYNFYEGSKEVRQACVFYNDGTIENCSFDEGIDYTLDLLREQKVTSKELSSIINNRNIHVMSGTELNKNFQKFIVKENNNEKEEDIITEEVISTPEEKLNDKDLSAYESLAKTLKTTLTKMILLKMNQKRKNQTSILK